MTAKLAGDRVALNPDPKLGPIIVQLLREGELDDAVALSRLAVSGTGCRVIERGPGQVTIRVRGTRRRFVLPADVVKSV